MSQKASSKTAAAVVAPLDLYSAEKGEISRTLYGQVQWEELLRNGIVLQHRDVSRKKSYPSTHDLSLLTMLLCILFSYSINY